MDDTVYKMQKRVEGESTEAAVYKEGNNRVTIDIPDVDDPQTVLDNLGKAGSLEFKDPNGEVVIDGSHVTTATAMSQQQPTTGINEYVVELTLNGQGTRKFADATEEFVGEVIEIVYDGEVLSSPVVESAITEGQAYISGGFQNFDDADALATQIRIGALPLELENIRSNIVGAKLGSTALRTSLIAGVIGLILVIIFMIIIYRLPGVASSLALLMYIVLVLIGLNVFNVTLTLPGIAGIILGVGMAVDANVIVFTRIKEEIGTGKTVTSAIKIGYEKALSAIIDGNVTTLIAAVVLYLMGSGTVKGFAETLGISIIVSMITALFVTRFIMIAFLHIGLDKEKFYGTKTDRAPINFVGNLKKYVLISSVLFLLCIGGLVYNYVRTGSILNYSLDFSGGASTSVTFDSSVNAEDQKQKVEELVKSSLNMTPEISTVEDENKVIARTTVLTQEEQKKITNDFATQMNIATENIEIENISATVSNEMRRDAVVAVLVAGICMLIYIWIRFRNFAFGASSVLALLHDVIVVLMIYAVFSTFILVGSTFIAVMLTIVGYSINSTIVIFDRVRENKKKAGNRSDMAELVNESITQTLSRSINTSLTTAITVIMLVILGVDSVRQFSIPLLAGIICGAYTSVCWAGTIWFHLNKIGKKNKKKR
jgi:SecD/SecF fusion protein